VLVRDANAGPRVGRSNLHYTLHNLFLIAQIILGVQSPSMYRLEHGQFINGGSGLAVQCGYVSVFLCM